MEYMRKVLVVSLISFLSVSAFGQLSTRENVDPYLFQIGTRPQAGDFGLYIGPSINEVIDMIDKDVNWRGMPLLNFKHYATDRFVWRLGLQVYNTSKHLNYEDGKGDDLYKEKNSRSNTYFVVTPAFEYHFTPENLCDVYLGMNLSLGVKSNVNKQYFFVDKEDYYADAIQNQFLLGVGGFVGLQFFIADLPLAIGTELGIRGFWNFNAKTKNVVTQPNDAGELEKQTFYTSDLLDDGVLRIGDKMSARKFDLGADFRITFSYYFSK